MLLATELAGCQSSTRYEPRTLAALHWQYVIGNKSSAAVTYSGLQHFSRRSMYSNFTSCLSPQATLTN